VCLNKVLANQYCYEAWSRGSCYIQGFELSFDSGLLATFRSGARPHSEKIDFGKASIFQRRGPANTDIKLLRLQTLRYFTEKVRAKVIAKIFLKRNNSSRHKYVMYFYLITYFLTPIFYISVRFLRYSIFKIFVALTFQFCLQIWRLVVRT